MREFHEAWNKLVNEVWESIHKRFPNFSPTSNERSNMSVSLGKTIKDTVTGYTGIAIVKTIHLNGNVQFAVQPRCKDGENSLPEVIQFDDHNLVVVEDGPTVAVTEPEVPKIRLGEEVVDVVSGLKGIATMEGIHLNGCIQFFVRTKAKEGTKDTGSTWVDHRRLDKVNDGVRSRYPNLAETATTEAVATSATESDKPKGGPNVRGRPMIHG